MSLSNIVHDSRELPFHGETVFSVESTFASTQNRIVDALANKGINLTEINNNFGQTELSSILPCKYYNEDDYTRIIQGVDAPLLNVFSLNISSLPKHRGELIAYMSNLPPFDILMLTEIGSKNIDLAVNAFQDYTFHYTIPEKTLVEELLFI